MTLRISQLARISSMFLLIVIALASRAYAENVSLSPAAAVRPYSASVFSQSELDYFVHETWCYETEPAYIAAAGNKLFQFDINSKAALLLQTPEYSIRRAACSEDGQTILAVSTPDVEKPTVRLSIFDAHSKEKAEYLVSFDDSLNANGYSFMSLDGKVFVLPSKPVLLSGPDLLRNKKIIQAASGNVFWTHSFAFVKIGVEGNRYQIWRLPSLENIGDIAFGTDRIVRDILECQGSYYAYFYIDEQQQEILQPIVDPRLGGRKGTVLKNVSSVEQSGSICSATLTQLVQSANEIRAVKVFDGPSAWLVDMSKVRRMGYSLSVSKDARFILGTQTTGPIGTSGKSRTIVFRINR